MGEWGLCCPRSWKVRLVLLLKPAEGLSPTEHNIKNYSSMKLEFLALKWAMAESAGNTC